MGLVLTNARKHISDNSETDKILDKLLNNPKLTDKHVKTVFKRTRPNRRKTIETINDKMYEKTLPYDNLAKNCKNYFNRMDINYNTKKVDELKMKNFLESCEKLGIIKLCQKEKILNLVLDNYSVHQSEYIKYVAELAL
jgi:hypothetical protein